ncbi:hypothetical protein DFJ73DRAFT_876205 [Zopfochytrium polystomum]|nr:hypothetical protein DFJ73DRAFT_876205 [Zopfochytrium polystomum]
MIQTANGSQPLPPPPSFQAQSSKFFSTTARRYSCQLRAVAAALSLQSPVTRNATSAQVSASLHPRSCWQSGIGLGLSKLLCLSHPPTLLGLEQDLKKGHGKVVSLVFLSSRSPNRNVPSPSHPSDLQNESSMKGRRGTSRAIKEWRRKEAETAKIRYAFPRARVVLVGDAGVGKSSLVRAYQPIVSTHQRRLHLPPPPHRHHRQAGTPWCQGKWHVRI